MSWKLYGERSATGVFRADQSCFPYKRFVNEYEPFLGNSNLAMVMCMYGGNRWFSHSGSDANSAISMSQNAGIDNLRNPGNDVANVGCSSPSVGGEGCVDASKLSMRYSRRSVYKLGASRRKKMLGEGIEEE